MAFILLLQCFDWFCQNNFRETQKRREGNATVEFSAFLKFGKFDHHQRIQCTQYIQALNSKPTIIGEIDLFAIGRFAVCLSPHRLDLAEEIFQFSKACCSRKF